MGMLEGERKVEEFACCEYPILHNFGQFFAVLHWKTTLAVILTRWSIDGGDSGVDLGISVWEAKL